MNIFKIIKDNLSQIYALTVKDVKLSLRFKYNLIFSYIEPIISIFLPIIIMGKLFDYNPQFGPWTKENYMAYQFIAMNLSLVTALRYRYPAHFYQEKWWQTFPALIIAPFNHINLLLGVFFSHFVMILPPFIIFFAICYFYVAVNLEIVIVMVGLYLLLALIFGGIGIVLGIFSITNEGAVTLSSFLISLVFFVSCISYPYEIFPGFIQQIINLNPFYYIFDLFQCYGFKMISSHFFFIFF